MSLPAKERKPILDEELRREFDGYDFPFENLALEGGGSKGLAYVGTFRVLEEVGIAKNLKRFSGSSIGAMMASFYALGYDSYEMEDMFQFDVSKLFTDAKFGVVGACLNLYRKMGAHPAHKLLEYFRERIQNKFGDPDLTFEQLFKRTGKELCLTSVSLNRMATQYLHVKTTPHMPIALAMRASVAVPGVMMPVKCKVMSKDEDVFVDGGILHNYPIDCYDGWFLSLDQKDSLFRRFSDVFSQSGYFAGFNKMSIGAVLYTGDEHEALKKPLEQRARKYRKPSEATPIPNTSRGRKRKKVRKERKSQTDACENALSKFVALLQRYDKDDSGTISKQEFMQSLNEAEEAFTDEDAYLLFGSSSKDPDAIFDSLDTNGNGEIEFCELLTFAERKGVDLMENLRGFERLDDFDDISSLFAVLAETLLVNANRISYKQSDNERTIGVNTGYLGSSDFIMEPEDRQYIQQCGKMGTVFFLREYIDRNNLQRKTAVVNCDGTGSGSGEKSTDSSKVASS